MKGGHVAAEVPKSCTLRYLGPEVCGAQFLCFFLPHDDPLPLSGPKLRAGGKLTQRCQGVLKGLQSRSLKSSYFVNIAGFQKRRVSHKSDEEEEAEEKPAKVSRSLLVVVLA